MEGDYGKLEFLKVSEILAENPRDKTVTILATDKDGVYFQKKSLLNYADEISQNKKIPLIRTKRRR